MKNFGGNDFLVESRPISLRLTTVAFVDVVSYSRLMAEDNIATIRQWSHICSEILLPVLEDRGGRLVNTAGDQLFVEFQSATDAVEWALESQAAIRALRWSERPMQVRIAINAGDVFEDGRDLRSDGVNIAARIQGHAAPGEVVVTQIIREIVRSRSGVSFRDIGAPTLKNIDHPVRLYVVEEKTVAPEIVRPHLSWSSRPTIAVLPFRTQGKPDESTYFGEGITEDIIAGISRSRAMFVVARNSTLQFNDDKASPKEIASALGVKYLLSGLLRRANHRLRITTELMDVDNDTIVWAERFDGAAADVFEFQDQIVASIVAALEPKVLSAEAARIGTRPTDSLDAYDCVLRALADLYRLETSSYRSALELLEKAVALDPGYAQAHAYLAWCLNFWIAEQISTDPGTDVARAIEHSRKAVELDPDDAVTLAVRSHILGLHEGEMHQALELLDEALTVNENLPLAWSLSATNHAYLGNGKEARERLLNVWRLTPYDPLNFFYWTAGGLAEFVAGEYDDAIHFLQRARHAKPGFMACLRLLAPALALRGDTEQAQQVAQEMIEREPGFSTTAFMSWYPLQDADTRERLILGLGAAGLPK
ncbi:MAG: adenylate/guanylate cyclase domain-containing protein [Pseudomonadota bacterium]